MIKKISIFSVAALSLAAVIGSDFTAKAELSGRDQFMLEQLRRQQASPASRSQEKLYYSGFVKLADGCTADQIERLGGHIINRIGDILIVDMPVDEIENIDKLAEVVQIELAQEMKPTMDNARQIGNVENIWNGVDLGGHSFDGSSGIILGLFDTGLDPNNPNFSDRVETVFLYNSNTPTQYTGSQIKTFTTDANTETHGTHVLGIMAGGLETIDRYKSSAGLGKEVTNSPNPFKGVAPGAPIMIGCGALANTYIMDGVKRMIEYAQSKGLHPVINLSLGNNSGSHDTNDPSNQTLGALAKNATIVVSSGNEGDENIALTKTFTATDNTLTSLIRPLNGSYFQGESCVLEVWGADNSDLTVKVVFYNASGNRVAANDILVTKAMNTTVQAANISGANYTSGSISYQKQTDANSKRVKATLSLSSLTGKAGSYRMGVEVTGSAGQRVDYFLTTSGQSKAQLSSFNIAGLSSPDGNMSINSMACADNVIAVGALMTKASWNTFLGNGYSDARYGRTNGNVYGFSSFGKLVDGRELPYFVAPGGMMSSLNSFYTSRYSNYEKNANTGGSTVGGMTNVNGRTYYWGMEMGTSMASPFAAGVLALWQQASLAANNRTLSTPELIKIAQETAITDTNTSQGNPLQWGAGKLNAYEGLKYVLNESSAIGQIWSDERNPEEALLMQLEGRNLNIFVAGASALDVKIFSVAGHCLYAAGTTGSETDIDTGHLQRGIYVVNVVTPQGGNYTKKISVR